MHNARVNNNAVKTPMSKQVAHLPTLGGGSSLQAPSYIHESMLGEDSRGNDKNEVRRQKEKEAKE